VFDVFSWVDQIAFSSYIILFYAAVLSVSLLIIDFIYVAYSLSRKRFPIMWPLYILRYVCNLFVTVLFFPLLRINTIQHTNSYLELLLSVLSCEYTQGQYTHILYPQMICFQQYHIIHSFFSIALSFIFMLISLLVSYTFFDTSFISKDPSAR
jgi:hypothetical protein